MRSWHTPTNSLELTIEAILFHRISQITVEPVEWALKMIQRWMRHWLWDKTRDSKTVFEGVRQFISWLAECNQLAWCQYHTQPATLATDHLGLEGSLEASSRCSRIEIMAKRVHRTFFPPRTSKYQPIECEASLLGTPHVAKDLGEIINYTPNLESTIREKN